MIENATPASLAHILDQALFEARETDRLTTRQPDLTLIDSYRVQAEGVELRKKRGETPIGFKLGFTSKAKMEQMGLFSPIYGVLTDRMQQPDGGTFSLSESIHPKIEPEIVFRLSKSLKGKVTFQEALEAVDGVTVGLEILDSRYVGFKYFSLPDVVADNCSSSAFVIGSQWHDPHSMDLASLRMVLEADGKPVHEALSSAILGHPVESVVQLCWMLNDSNLGVPAGSLIFAGSATPAIPLEKGMKVSARVEKLGTVSIQAVGDFTRGLKND